MVDTFPFSDLENKLAETVWMYTLHMVRAPVEYEVLPY